MNVDGEEDGAGEEWSTEYNDVIVDTESEKSKAKLGEDQETLKPVPDVIPDTMWAVFGICWMDSFSTSFVAFVQMLQGENVCWENSNNDSQKQWQFLYLHENFVSLKWSE